MLYYPWAKLNVGSELRCLLIIGGYRKTLEVGFSPCSPSISPETEGFEWKSSSTSWKRMTMCRTCGTTGRSNSRIAISPFFQVIFEIYNFLIHFLLWIFLSDDIHLRKSSWMMRIPNRPFAVNRERVILYAGRRVSGKARVSNHFQEQFWSKPSQMMRFFPCLPRFHPPVSLL